MAISTFFIWVLLLAVLGWSIYWHLKENKQLIENWKKTMDQSAVEWHSRFAWSRSIQLIAALAGCILLIMIYSYKLDSTSSKYDELTLIHESTIRQISQPQPQMPRRAASQDKPAIPTQPDYYPPSNQVAGAPAATPPAVPVVAPTVTDIFTPSETSSDQQTTMDSIKQRYEDILVIYMFLSKCKKAKTEDYYIIMSALSQDMASVNAPGRMQNDVLTAAQGSYEEMYAQSDCSSLDINALHTQYTDYIKALSQYNKAP